MTGFDREDRSALSSRSRFRVLNLIRQEDARAVDAPRGFVLAVTDEYDFACFNFTCLQDVI
jgi:hypothetical protein